MVSKLWRILVKVFGIIVLLGALIAVFIPPMLYYYYRRFIYTSTDVVPKEKSAVLVLGASVLSNETPSSALQERLDVAADLYKQDKVSSIIVSGASDENGFYNEPKAMKASLQKSGVPEALIVEDSEGNRTYESCYRAKHTFEMNNLIVISQGYHLPRALFLCRSLGVDATGVFSVGAFSTYYNRWYTVREVLAMYVAVWDIITTK